MALERGILRVRRKNNQPTYQVQIADKPAMNIAQGEVSQTLLQQLATFENQEVEFERISGQPKQVREPGGTFVATGSSGGRSHSQGTSPSSRPNTQTHRQQSHHSQRNSSQRDHQQQPRPHRENHRQMNSMPQFNNPYNFVPAPPRNTTHKELGDHEPVYQDSFDPARYTGRIHIHMEVKTPLLVPDTENTTQNNDGHKTSPLWVDSDGKPVIPASSVRGMLRSAYEIVTNSRFGRFSPKLHDRLAFRMDTRDALQLIPARIENDHIHLFTGTSQIGKDGKAANNGPMYAAWLRRYDHRGRLAPHTPRYPGDSLPEHGDLVFCWVEKIQHHRWDRRNNQHIPDFQYWSVRHIARSAEELPDNPQPTQNTSRRDRQSWHQSLDVPMKRIQGWVCITNANINRKHDERVFFVDPATTSPQHGPFPVNDEHREMWRELIENYQDIHKDELDKRHKKNQGFDEYLGNDPGKTAWSRHVYTDGVRVRVRVQDLRDGTLCYVRLNQNKTQVEAMFPVIISRELYSSSPWNLLDRSLRPASSLQELSPADRVFGWVRSDADRNNSSPTTSVAARGLLRVSPILCNSSAQDSVESFGGNGVPLAILATPKPQQGRFYVAISPNGNAQPDGLSKTEAGYSDSNGLRGRKVYPHQRSLPPQHWDNPTQDRTQHGVGQPSHYQEYRRPKEDGQEKRDDQNQSILGWIKPRAKFSFDLHVHNLSKVELGALLWLLCLPDDAYFRLGGGKPLGFGSVRLSLDHSNTDVCTDQALRDRYEQWHKPSTNNTDINRIIDDFKAAICDAFREKDFENIPWIRAFLTACRGYDNNWPIHYPRLAPSNASAPPHPEGKSFEWFVENERDQDRRYSLPGLTSQEGLPYWPPRPRHGGN